LDIARIAEALAAALAPVLPSLLKADGHGAGGGVSAELQTLWEGARQAIEARSAALEAAVDLAQAPGEEDCRGAWRRQPRKILEADPELAREMARLLDRAGVRIEVKVQGEGAAAVGDGAAAVGDGAVAAGQGGYAAGRDQTIHYHGVVPPNAEGDPTAREVYLRRLIGLTEMLPLQGIDHDRLVLLGDPGSGKSTFLNEQLRRAIFTNDRLLALARAAAPADPDGEPPCLAGKLPERGRVDDVVSGRGLVRPGAGRSVAVAGGSLGGLFSRARWSQNRRTSPG
jgi:hypothetical protein